MNLIEYLQIETMSISKEQVELLLPISDIHLQHPSPTFWLPSWRNQRYLD